MNRKKEHQTTCLDLALEGEQFCKLGEFQKGVQQFESALEIGTNDLQTLSAIYSQLGNAYYYLQQYDRALEFHHNDLKLTRYLCDKINESKALGNLANTLKIMGRFDEAVVCCKQHLSTSQLSEDRVGEACALYSLGNIYLSKAKKVGHHNHDDPGVYPAYAKLMLNEAVNVFRANMKILTELGDQAALGRTCGNLGNAYYLLGNFENAIRFHLQRLRIAKEFGDKSAERRAYCNLGNAYMFLSEYITAADHYKMALYLSKQMKDRSLEGKACYSLGNVYTLSGDHEKAVEYHMLHLEIALELNDAVELVQAYWSLGNIFTQIGDTEKASAFIRLHLELAIKTGDTSGQVIAQEKLKQLSRELGLGDLDSFSANPRNKDDMGKIDSNEIGTCYRSQIGGHSPDVPSFQPSRVMMLPAVEDEDGFFNMLSRFQGRRLDDQRCSYRLVEINLQQVNQSSATPCIMQNEINLASASQSYQSNSRDSLSSIGFGNLSGIRGASSHSIVESHLPGLITEQPANNFNNDSRNRDVIVGKEQLVDLISYSQNMRFEDQRSFLTSTPVANAVHEEDLFSLIQRLQSSRIDNQRSEMPTAFMLSSNILPNSDKKKSLKKQK